MTNQELIALAREHATYDLPYSTLQLLEDLADALEREEALKCYEQLVAVLPDDLGMLAPLDIPHWFKDDSCGYGIEYECSKFDD